jgi:serine protein kinase
MDLMTRLEQYRLEEKQLTWTGPFADYFELVRRNPHVSQLAHARIHTMIADAGVETDDKTAAHYQFFDDEIYGLDKTIQQIVEYFRSASQRLEVRKRILLLMGPVGGGKSTIVTLLKRGLERYTRTESGAVYAIQGCPMHEEPLHQVPETLRGDVLREYGLFIEGDLCPQCRYNLEHRWDNTIEQVPVVRIAFSGEESSRNWNIHSD